MVTLFMRNFFGCVLVVVFRFLAHNNMATTSHTLVRVYYHTSSKLAARAKHSSYPKTQLSAGMSTVDKVPVAGVSYKFDDRRVGWNRLA